MLFARSERIHSALPITVYLESSFFLSERSHSVIKEQALPVIPVVSNGILIRCA